MQRRGLQINSLLNDSDEAATRTKRRSSLHEWQGERDGPAHAGYTRDASVPPALYARQAIDLDRRPATADRIEAPRPISSDGRAARPNLDERARAYERIEVPRSSAEIRDVRDMREGSGDSRSWMYDLPYEAHHRRPSPTPGYAPMAPPSHPVERGLPPSRYSMPPSSASGPSHLPDQCRRCRATCIPVRRLKWNGSANESVNANGNVIVRTACTVAVRDGCASTKLTACHRQCQANRVTLLRANSFRRPVPALVPHTGTADTHLLGR